MRSYPVGLDFWSDPSSTSILNVCDYSEGSGETARMRRLAWAFVGRLCDKYHNLMSWLNCGRAQNLPDHQHAIFGYLHHVVQVWHEPTAVRDRDKTSASRWIELGHTGLLYRFRFTLKVMHSMSSLKLILMGKICKIYCCTCTMLEVKWAASWQNQQSDCAPSEDSDQPGHPPSLIRVFAVRSGG